MKATNQSLLTRAFRAVTFRPMQKLIYLLVLGVSMNAAWASSGDGGGINGPDLGGESIPVGLDGGLTVEGIKEAVLACYVKSDSRSTLLKKYSQMVLGEPVDEPGSRLITRPNAFRYEVRDSREKLYIMALSNVVVDRANCSESEAICHEPNYLVWMSTMKYGDLNLPYTFDVDFGTRLKLGERPFTLTATDAMPMIGWKGEQYVCDGYDELGRCVSERTYVSEARIQKGNNHGTAVPLWNKNTGQLTAVRLNAEEVYQCLLTELRQSALRDKH